MSKFLSLLSTVWGFVGKKATITLAGLALATIHARWPALPLPSTDLIVDAVAALLSCHTLTDVVHIIATAAAEASKAKTAGE